MMSRRPSMNEIKQTAGQCTVKIAMCGWPHWSIVTIGDVVAHGLTPDDLHDLRYCIDRALDQVPRREHKP